MDGLSKVNGTDFEILEISYENNGDRKTKMVAVTRGPRMGN